MNQWKELWLAYHNEATRIKIMNNMWHHASIWDRFFILLNSSVFFGSMIMHFSQQGWWLLPTVVSEIALLYKFSSLKQELVLNEYGGYDNSQTPPSNDNHQDTRYLIFKNHLKNLHINKSHVEECYDLVESQIDIATTDSTGMKKLSAFSLGLLAGVLAALWKQFDVNTLIIIAISIIGFALLISVFSSAFLSKAEKLKELKYFMLLFCREAP